MNCEALSQKLKDWFRAYVNEFSSEDPLVQKNMDLKAGHTRRVCDAIITIGHSLGLSVADLCIAEVCALLHDIGRFEQFKRYKTFSDNKSEDHAALGVKVVESRHVLEGIDPDMAGMIERVIACHNRASLPADEEERTLFFLKLLRDADKVDIFRVVTEYYQDNGQNRNQGIELDLPDEPGVSYPVYEALMKRKVVRMADMRTFNDFKLLRIGWVYDINFPMTYRIIREGRYLEKIREALPVSSEQIDEVYSIARSYLEEHS